MTGQKKIPSFDLTRNYNRVKEEVRVALDRVLGTQHFILGPEVEAFVANVRQTIDRCVQAMPKHQAFIERHCRAPSIS